ALPRAVQRHGPGGPSWRRRSALRCVSLIRCVSLTRTLPTGTDLAGRHVGLTPRRSPAVLAKAAAKRCVNPCVPLQCNVGESQVLGSPLPSASFGIGYAQPHGTSTDR